MVVGVGLGKGPAHIDEEAGAAAFWTGLGVELAGEVPSTCAIGSASAGRASSRRGPDRRPQAAEPPSLQLVYIAVRPSGQGRGAGHALMAPVLTRCDECTEHAYLHATNAATVGFYERLGFRALATSTSPTAGPSSRRCGASRADPGPLHDLTRPFPLGPTGVTATGMAGRMRIMITGAIAGAVLVAALTLGLSAAIREIAHPAFMAFFVAFGAVAGAYALGVVSYQRDHDLPAPSAAYSEGYLADEDPEGGTEPEPGRFRLLRRLRAS